MAVLEKDGKGDISGVKALLTLEYESKEIAERVLLSLTVDNYSFISCKREKNKIICCAEAKEVSTMLHTLDDFLSCVITAESVYQSI